MSREGVEKVLKNGGMPVPSVAITKFDIPFTDFGEISFIGTPEMIDPSKNDVRVLTNDAWTPTIPTPEFKMQNPNKVLTEEEKEYLEKNEILNYLTNESDARTAIMMAEDIGEGLLNL
jgi:hypothetical protein